MDRPRLGEGTIIGALHIPSVLLQRETRPMAALAWILCLLSLPIVGVLLWWMIGRARIEARRREWQASHEDIAEELTGMTESMSMPAAARRDVFDDLDDEGTRGANASGIDLTPDADEVDARFNAGGPDKPESIIRTVFFMAITSARSRIWITTPYFVPDQAVLTAIGIAAYRGVDVRILVPGRSDVPVAQAAGRSYFDELLAAGARMFEYQQEVLHAKTLVSTRSGS